MTLENRFNQSYQRLQTGVDEWQQISQLQPGEKPQLPEKQAWEEVMKTVSKITSIFSSKMESALEADDEERIASLKTKIIKTQNEIRELVQTVDETNTHQLKTALTALGKLRTQLTTASSVGLANLKETYKGKTTEDGKPVEALLTSQQKQIANQLVGEIDKYIVNLGSKLQEIANKEAARIEQREQMYSQAKQQLISRAFDEASTLVPVVSPTKQTSAIPALIDPTFHESWGAVVARGEDKTFLTKPKIREEAANPALIPGRLIAREIVDRTSDSYQPKMLQDTAGQEVQTPAQFAHDIPRSRLLLVNGTAVYSDDRASLKNTAEAFKNLRRACAKEGRSPEEAAKLADRICTVINQGIVVDMLGKMNGVYTEDRRNPLGGDGSKLVWSVDIDQDKVTISLKFSYALRDYAKHSLNPYPGAILAKREIELPIDCLLLNDDQYTQEALPGVKVTDTYSQLIQSAVYAESLLLAF